ncbi:thioredoxin family protein [Dysgonomonas sp. Marseille-P4677]|uniref:peroxiredoxin family protein n=1 Tax=Dysgonomonas sp. Marseille-P4677 TaxID=2364790 RepID=UPI0019140E92|nr:thioredoxin family protein [Dysgonomonas sp. Marseille-P4677]MBK5722735.1 thioredoxin family protein [Dysgonomonas sp. Marseille-P4677]
MKKTFTALLLLSFVLSLSAQETIIIDEPYYEVKNSGIENISKIELTPTQMKLHVHTTFIPNWWVKFPRTTFIQPEGKDKIYATDIEKGEFDKEIYMPSSGDSTFVLIFPRPDEPIESFDFGEEEKAIIFGVSLEKNRKKLKEEKIKKQQQAEKEALAWLEGEITKSEKQPLKNYNSTEFFNQGMARFIGYIKGYNSKAGKNTGIVYASNELTRENFPIVIEIQPDGRFDVNIPMSYPTMVYITILDNYCNLYMEQGCILGGVLDWEDFLLADRYRNKREELKIDFYGPLAEVNSGIKAVKLETYNWKQYNEDIKSNTPESFKILARDLYERNKKTIIEKGKGFPEKGVNLLNNIALMDYGYLLMDFAGMRKYYAKEDSANTIIKTPLPIDYYNFLEEFPLDSQSILVSSSASSFINRFEYCDHFTPVFSMVHDNIVPKKSYLRYLLEDENIELTEEEVVIKEFDDKVGGKTHFSAEEWDKVKDIQKANKAVFEAFYKKNESYYTKYQEKYGQNPANDDENKKLKEWRLKDSILLKDLNIRPNLISQIFKVRELKQTFENMEKEDAERIIDGMDTYIKHPFLKSEAQRIFSLAYPVKVKERYELPQTQAADIFRNIVASFKGKYILVDFWDIYCGPCILGIKDMKAKREELKGNSDIEFVFITSTSGSPKDRYDKFVEEQDLVHTYRLSDDDYNRMRELFKFNGIPHYETVDREGLVMKKSITSHNFDHDFEQLIKSEKK